MKMLWEILDKECSWGTNISLSSTTSLENTEHVFKNFTCEVLRWPPRRPNVHGKPAPVVNPVKLSRVSFFPSVVMTHF